MFTGALTGNKFNRSKKHNSKLIDVVIAACLFVIASGFIMQDVAAESDEEILRNISTQAAEKVAAHIANIQKQLDDLAQDQTVISLFTGADVMALESKAGEMQSDFESALKLRLLLPGNYEMGGEVSPPLSFASLDLLRRAEESATPVDVEAHSMGGDGAHIALVSRVSDAESNLIGLLHLSMPLGILEPVISDLNTTETYIEIQQGRGRQAPALTGLDSNNLRTGNPVTVAIKGSKWSAASWDGSGEAVVAATAGSSQPTTEEGSSMSLIIIVILVLAAAASGFIFYRRQHPGAGSKKALKEEAVYQGAVKAIVDGEHPGLEKLVPGLPKSGHKTASGAISKGLQGDDITTMATDTDTPSEAVAEAVEQNSSNEAAPAEETPVQDKPVQQSPEAAPEKAAEAASVASADVEISPEIFRTYDIRGVVSAGLSAAVVQKIGRAIGSEAHERGQASVVVARDGRLSSPELGDALIDGLRASGRDVIDIGVVPTPVLYFATNHLEAKSGVMLTGSHNGPEYNGLKIVLDGETLSGDAITKIRDRITNNDMSAGQGSLETTDISADYLRTITDDIPVALGGAFRIVVDCGNGVAGNLAPQLYRAMGHDVVELFCEIDGNFPNHHPDPSQPENMQTLIDIVKEEHADLGFAFDGDGDRLGIVDGEGNVIWPDRQMMLFARDVLSRNQGASIIFDVKCSRHLKSIIEENGGTPLMWKTGHSLIKSKMKEVDAPLAGELSGHIFFKERWFGFDDALYAGARALEILTNSKKSPTEVFAELPEDVSTPELRIPLAEKNHAKAMEIMKKNMAFEGAEITDIDGIRVDFPDGWGLVRPSNTSPFLVARFEAESAAALERIQAEFRNLLHSVSTDLKLPF